MFDKKSKQELKRQVAVVQDVNERIFSPPRARTFSEAAAEAAQYVIDLENKLQQFDEALRKEKTRNDLVEEANKMLHEDAAHVHAQHEVEIDKLKRERDYYYQNFCRMRTRLQVNAGIILDALEESKTVVELENEVKAEVQKLTEQEEKMLDKFRPVKPATVEKEIEDLFLNHKTTSMEKKDDTDRV